jgi:hypothetical protein
MTPRYVIKPSLPLRQPPQHNRTVGSTAHPAYALCTSLHDAEYASAFNASLRSCVKPKKPTTLRARAGRSENTRLNTP